MFKNSGVTTSKYLTAKNWQEAFVDVDNVDTWEFMQNKSKENTVEKIKERKGVRDEWMA